MSDHLALRPGAGRVREAVATSSVDVAERGWILLLPAVVLVVLAIVLLAPLGGRLLLPDPGYHYWFDLGVRKPTVHVGYLLFVVVALAYAVAIVRLTGLSVRPVARRVLVAGAQLAGAAFVVVCWLAQRRFTSAQPTTKLYFTPATLIVAAVATVSTGLLIHRLRTRSPSRDLLAPLRRLDAGTLRRACLGVAVLATALWLLPAIHTEQATPSGNGYLGALFFDESASVLDGRSPLVNMVTYGSLWAYVVALPVGAIGGSYAAFTVTMATIAGLSLLAVHDVLRRVAGSPLLALGLYLPVLATGFFLIKAQHGDRYDPGTYFGMFPLRYAGPYLLAWLTARQLGRGAPSRRALRLLFAAAGLVALNNVDFGGAALAATATALLVVRRPRDRETLARLAVDVAIGLALAFALVSALTLVRAGSLPHLDLLVRFGRVFVDGGYGNLPLPRLGLHLVMSATFVAAAAVAAVRVVRTRPGDLLAGMLAWCAIFGFGASVYYYAYRSHPEVLVSLFSIWSLTLALLIVAALRETPRPHAWPGAPALALSFAFALAVCSLAQVPSPWSEVRRIATATPVGQSESVPAEGFRQTPVARIVAERTHAGERVVILSPVGHRVAWDAGVVNVSPYTGLEQMPALEQLDETVGILEREGGHALFVAERPPPGLEAELSRLGLAAVERWNVEAWPEEVVTEYRVA